MPQEKVNNLRFLDGQRKEIDFLQGLNFYVLDQAAQLGDVDPLLILGLAPASSMAWTPTRPRQRPQPWMPLPNPPRKPLLPPIPGPVGPPGPPRSTGVIRHLMFLGKKRVKICFKCLFNYLN